jgi:hypothetical protein
MNEIFFDRISNISVQGPIVSIDLSRATSSNETKEVIFDKKVTITCTTQNLMNFINTLNQTGLAIKKQYESTKAGVSEQQENIKTSKKK